MKEGNKESGEEICFLKEKYILHVCLHLFLKFSVMVTTN